MKDAELYIRQTKVNELIWINQCYNQIDFLPSDDKDYIIIAEIKEQKAGIGRIIPMAPRVGEMGGIYVLPEFRGQNIASKIVEHLSKYDKYDFLYCIAFSHLANFYTKYGFKYINKHIKVHQQAYAKFKYCCKTYPNSISFMYKDNNNNQ